MPRFENISADELRVDETRMYLPLSHVLDAYNQGRIEGETRRVPLPQISVDPTFIDPEGIEIYRRDWRSIRLHREEAMQTVVLLRRPDGTLWSYDDAHFVTVAKERAPQMLVPCRIFDDPSYSPEAITTGGRS